MQNNLVSIIITTYGRTDTLKRAILSVLDQTYSPFEVIIVDDNANKEMSDKIEMIIKEVDDSRVRVIHNPINMGGALARNVGIQNAIGEYVAFLDDDDQYLPNKIEKQVKLLNENEDCRLALVYCWDKSIDEKGKIIYSHRENITGNCLFEGMYDCIASTSLWLCRKKCLEEVGGFTDTPCKQDSYVLVKLLVAGFSVDRVPEYLAIYNDAGGDRISTQGYQKRIKGEEKLRELCRKHYEMLSHNEIKDVEYAFSARLAEYYFCAGRHNEGYKCMKKVVFTHPIRRLSLRCYKRCFKVLIRKVFT